MLHAIRRQPVAKTFGGLAVAATGLWLIATQRTPAVGWALLTVGGAIALLSARSLAEDKEIVTLDDQGITSSLMPVGMIPWSDIRGAELRAISRMQVIALEVADTESYIKRLPTGRQHIARIAVAAGLPPLYFPLTGTDGNADQVLTLIRQQVARRGPDPA